LNLVLTYTGGLSLPNLLLAYTGGLSLPTLAKPVLTRKSRKSNEKLDNVFAPYNHSAPDTLHHKSSNLQPFKPSTTKMADTWNIVSAAVNKLLCVLGDPEACGGVDTPAFAESLQLPRDHIIAHLGRLRHAVQAWPPVPELEPDELEHEDKNARIYAAIIDIYATVVNGDAHQILLDVIEGVEADIIEDFGDDFDDNDENDY
jgi:hypothetical protein